MAFYPDPNQPPPAHPGRQPWPYGTPPAQGGSPRPWGVPPEHLYGNAPVPSLPSGSPGARTPSSPDWAVSPPSWQPAPRPVSTSRPLVLALLAFPFLSLKMWVWPGPATFAKEKDRVGWLAIVVLLLGGAALTGLLASLWGRFPPLMLGIEQLSAGRVVPQPLPAGVCLGLAVGVPALFLLLEGILYGVAKQPGGKPGRWRAQLYTGLLIEAPLVAVLVAMALVLVSRPDLGSSARVLVVGGAAAFLLYSLLLHVCAVMAVHQVSAGKAMLCVALVVVILAVVVVVVWAVADSSGDGGGSGHGGGSSGHTNGGDHGHHQGGNQREGSSRHDDIDLGGGDGKSGRRAPARVYRLLYPNCGQQLPATLRPPGFPCPRCGTPMM